MSEFAARRRWVRKGTHSCWECRRRKTKCRFSGDDGTTCVGCQARGTECVSQEVALEPSPTKDRYLAQRVRRLESMMEKMAQQAVSAALADPDRSAARFRPRDLEPPASLDLVFRDKDVEIDLLDSSAVRNAQEVALISSCSGHATATYDSLPRSPPGRDNPPIDSLHCSYIAKTSISRCSRNRDISRLLYSLLPSPETRAVLALQSPGARDVLNLFHAHPDQLASNDESPACLAYSNSLDESSHPTLLAKRLLQFTVCMQQLPPNFDLNKLGLDSKLPCQSMRTWTNAVSALVTSNDDLVGCLEGLECLIIESIIQGDAGHLRKAWMVTRRALSMAQLMGIDRRNPPPIISCSPDAENKRRPSTALHWSLINCSDRYHSLILGLPMGSTNNAFAASEPRPTDPSLDRLFKSHAVIAGRISDRNDLVPGSVDAYTVTQSIDLDLERSATEMGSSWWLIPDLEASLWLSSSDYYFSKISMVRIQVRHYILLILLHLPYLLRDRDERRYEYNRTTCLHASRAVLDRFLAYRSVHIAYVTGRHVDYAALVAAMTLVLGHLAPRFGDDAQERTRDRDLAERAERKFQELARLKCDRLSSDSATTIRQLLPILQHDTSANNNNVKTVQLTIPFLGTVTINSKQPRPHNSTPAAPFPSTDIPTPVLLNQTLNDADNSPPLTLSFDPNGPLPQGQVFMDDVVQDSTAASGADILGEPSWQDFTADLDGWSFQGVDTTYWSTLNHGML